MMSCKSQYSKEAINLCIAARLLSDEGHDDFNQGQISTRKNREQNFRIKRAVCGFNEMMPKDIIECSANKNIHIANDAPPETPLHQAVYNRRPDVKAIIHTHAPHCLVFGASNEDVNPISHEGAYFHKRVPRFYETSHTILDYEVADQVALTLMDHPALFLVNHGVLIAGKTLRQCAVLAVMLERACKLQLLANASGIKYRVSSVEDIDKKRQYIFSDVSIKTYWDQVVGRISRGHPDLMALVSP